MPQHMQASIISLALFKLNNVRMISATGLIHPLQ
jgi:hypothetical protein